MFVLLLMHREGYTNAAGKTFSGRPSEKKHWVKKALGKTLSVKLFLRNILTHTMSVRMNVIVSRKKSPAFI
jgi:hypothetical protein